MKSAVIYTKDNCPYCDFAKQLLTKNAIQYTENKIGGDIMREEFIELFPDQRTVPLIFVNGDKIGGYTELQEFFKNESNKTFLTED